MLPEDITLFRPYIGFTSKCLVELAMLKMSQEIREKPKWYEKVSDPEIVAKWKEEAKAQDISSEAADYVIEEVKHYATIREGSIEPGPIDGTWKADELIEEKLREKFKSLVAELENVPADKKISILAAIIWLLIWFIHRCTATSKTKVFSSTRKQSTKSLSRQMNQDRRRSARDSMTRSMPPAENIAGFHPKPQSKKTTSRSTRTSTIFIRRITKNFTRSSAKSFRNLFRCSIER